MPPLPESSPQRPSRDRAGDPVATVARRTVLGVLGLGAPALLAACSPARSADLDAPASGAASDDLSAAAATLGSTSADRRLVEVLRRELSVAHATVGAQARRTPSLRAELAGFAHLHARHAQALGGLTPTAPRASGTTSTTSARLRADEDGLQARLISASVRAASGSLAALLASMAAAQAQLVSRL